LLIVPARFRGGRNRRLEWIRYPSINDEADLAPGQPDNAVSAEIEKVRLESLRIRGSTLTTRLNDITQKVLVLWVDAHDRPDILDLPRVVHQEGGRMHSRMSWRAYLTQPTGLIVLTIRRIDSMPFTMQILFELPDDQELLEEVVEAEHVGITPYPIAGDGAFDPKRAILFRCPGDPLGLVGRTIAQVEQWQS
jgi:hypothetical protein